MTTKRSTQYHVTQQSSNLNTTLLSGFVHDAVNHTIASTLHLKSFLCSKVHMETNSVRLHEHILHHVTLELEGDQVPKDHHAFGFTSVSKDEVDPATCRLVTCIVKDSVTCQIPCVSVYCSCIQYCAPDWHRSGQN